MKSPHKNIVLDSIYYLKLEELDKLVKLLKLKPNLRKARKAFDSLQTNARVRFLEPIKA